MQSSSSTSSFSSSHQPQPSSRNWETSFGKLSTAYGVTGSVPSLPPKSAPGSTKSTTSSRSVSPQPSTRSQSPKNYEGTFGHLSSSYGFTNSYPTVPSKALKSKTPSVSQTSVKSGKDYQKSLDDLLVSNGFGGPYLPTRV